MTVSIIRLTGAEAYDLIYPEYLATMSELNQETMQRSMRNSSTVWIGYEGNKVLGFWGLIPPTLLSDRAYLWLSTTRHMPEHVFIFVRYSQRVIEEMLQLYPLIVGHCAVGQAKSKRWLRWLGAEFGPVDGALIPFEIKAP
jgi:hypothetical protein